MDTAGQKVGNSSHTAQIDWVSVSEVNSQAMQQFPTVTLPERHHETLDTIR
jgi:hypothetical protein